MSLPTSTHYPLLPSPFLSTFPQTHDNLPLPPSTATTRSKSSWIETLRSQTRSKQFRDAISTFIQMQLSSVQPDNFAFPASLKAVTALQDLNLGKQIHGSVVKLGYDSSSVTVANTLLHMYGKCGDDIDQVLKVFARIPQKDQVSWNSIINALCKHEEWELAIEAFRLMRLEKIEPSSFTLVSLLLACSNLSRSHGLRIGKQVHGYSLRVDDRKTFTNNSLMAMYSKLGRVDVAKAIFERFIDRDMVSWNTIISSFSQNDRFYEALECLSFMIVEGFKPDGITISKTEDEEKSDLDDNILFLFKPNSITLMTVLPSCAGLAAISKGKEIHACAIRNVLESDVAVGSALVDMSGFRLDDAISIKIGKKMPFNSRYSKSVEIRVEGEVKRAEYPLAQWHRIRRKLILMN
ncbi:unnamed protein product [Fraxinus pennsylvanica]|uniref:Pentatricopeptide repeat-containing protein n=1 Tax=Fraxinus pennsylvanica TaxID=56036 RepID=A0AAD2A5Y5_9LAMI|nr:unnamed protein product [Fraxinus pennsylvanica]